MTIKRVKRLETQLLSKFRQYLSKQPRTGIHVSDLTSPLLAYWKRKKPLPPTKEEILYWLGGQAHHTLLVAAVTGVEDSQEQSQLDAATGVTFSPDLLKLKGEFKTTRAVSIPQSEADAKRRYAEYVKQCRMYAALLKTTVFKLIIYFFAVEEKVSDFYTSRKPDFRAYALEFTEQELEKERQHVTVVSQALALALATDNPSPLPLCMAWKCYSIEKGKKVGKCPYWEDCKPPGRYTDVTTVTESFDD
jgi:hypothetical protein